MSLASPPPARSSLICVSWRRTCLNVSTSSPEVYFNLPLLVCKGASGRDRVKSAASEKRQVHDRKTGEVFQPALQLAWRIHSFHSLVFWFIVLASRAASSRMAHASVASMAPACATGMDADALLAA